MKVAFHFFCSFKGKTGLYTLDAETLIFSIISAQKLAVRTKWYSGDLLFNQLASDHSDNDRGGWTETFNPDKYNKLLKMWISDACSGWFHMSLDQIESLAGRDIFTICAETMDQDCAESIHDQLSVNDFYLGAFEVSDESRIHWELYSNMLFCQYRSDGKKMSVFWDGISEDSKDSSAVTYWKDFGFEIVEFESLNAKRSLFDIHHNYEHGLAMSRWRKHASGLLSSAVDSITYQLSDAAPDLGKKLWTAVNAFSSADTDEDYAHVALSCRRIIEYVADELFPPVENAPAGQNLDKQHFRNRLLAFADNERQSNASIDLIQASTDMLSEQLKKLSELQNKGIHGGILQNEARRCLIRTFLLLDDIASLREAPLPVKTKLDWSWLTKEKDG
ncbi:MAG: hypothetical protein A2283_18990 [Lentisphaerae bacterium RIFOXYA12_FULL_48_11]|nr:MAG: hypothetical protein A2283_18990 [Lentisphaerae bacterium RIFOXYA12_FULL_48_11]